jgi:hypothetical protein
MHKIVKFLQKIWNYLLNYDIIKCIVAGLLEF